MPSTGGVGDEEFVLVIGVEDKDMRVLIEGSEEKGGDNW